MHIFLIFLLLTILNDKRLDAQSGTSGAISGTVTDATGATLTDAAVKASDLETKAVRQGKSNAEGRFLFSQVNPGTYAVTVGAPGFAGQTSQPVSVEVGRTVTLNFRLVVSSAAQTVEVSANQELSSLENPNTTTTLRVEDDRESAQPGPGPDLSLLSFRREP